MLNGGIATFGDAWSQLVYRVGQDAHTAQLEQASRGEVVRQIDDMRDSVSGAYVFSGGQAHTPAYAPGPPISAYQGDAQAEQAHQAALGALSTAGRLSLMDDLK